MADDLGERTEDPTPKRRQESREKGQVAKSSDLASVSVLFAATVTLAFAAWWMLEHAARLLRALLGPDMVGDQLDQTSATEVVAWVGDVAVRTLGPVLFILMVFAALGHMVQIGPLFAPKALEPKLSKLDVIKGFGRIYGLKAQVKALIDILKVSVVVIVAVVTIRQYEERIVVLPYLEPSSAAAALGWILLDVALRLLAVLLVLAVVDLIYQRWRQTEELRMTKQQVKDEMKSAEGDPENKKRRMRMQQQIAMQRVGSSVPTADVIVTNPEHYSVAIRYDAEKMNAPVVVARGVDHLAMRIRQIAMRHDIPIVQRPPLARALYRDVEVGQPVPPAMYDAVAEVLAYVYRIGGRAPGRPAA